MNIDIPPLDAEWLRRVREEGLDALDQPAEQHVAAGGEPCRDVLRRARPGERLLLASHSPFGRPGPYREFGPIFVLAQPSEEVVDRRRLPMQGDGPEVYFRERLGLRAYSGDQRILDARLIALDAVESTLDELLARRDTAYVHARFPAYGCFACRIDRRDDPPALRLPRSAT